MHVTGHVPFVLGCSLALVLAGCGGSGGGGGSSSDGGSTLPPGEDQPGSVALQPGSATVDSSGIADGIVQVSFPQALGDGPVISAASPASGKAVADIDESKYPPATKGITVYFPLAGKYTIRITINDAGDAPQIVEVPVTIPETAAFTVSGGVKDGPTGSEAGVTTGITLYWQPVATEAKIAAATKDSNAGSGGSFSFTKLVGDPSAFSVKVAAGTK